MSIGMSKLYPVKLVLRIILIFYVYQGLSPPILNGQNAKMPNLFGSRKELKATLPANKINDKSATVFIRPEHALGPITTATITGTLTNILFFHLTLEKSILF